MESRKTGNTWPPMRYNLQQADGTAIPLDGATVRFIMQDSDGNEVIDGPASIVDLETGLVQYDWQEGDTDTEGTYNAQWEVTFGDGKKCSVPNNGNIEIAILENLDMPDEP